MHNIQIVDDDVLVLQALQRLLRIGGYQVQVFEQVADALHALSHTTYSVIIADYRMPKLDGVSYLEWARQKQPDATRLMLSAFPETDAILQAINRAEVFRFITKPWCNAELLTTVANALARNSDTPLSNNATSNIRKLLAEAEAEQLERIEPGITRIEFDEDGAIALEFNQSSCKGDV